MSLKNYFKKGYDVLKQQYLNEKFVKVINTVHSTYQESSYYESAQHHTHNAT